MEVPKNGSFLGETKCLSLWPSYIGEKRTSGKTYGIKSRCYWNTLEEHTENLMGTHWELERNMLGTMKK